MDPMPSDAPELEAHENEVPEGDNDQSLCDRMSLLEERFTELQRNVAAPEATTQRAIASDSLMLAELEKASEQLLCKHSKTSSVVCYGAS